MEQLEYAAVGEKETFSSSEGDANISPDPRSSSCEFSSPEIFRNPTLPSDMKKLLRKPLGADPSLWDQILDHRSVEETISEMLNLLPNDEPVQSDDESDDESDVESDDENEDDDESDNESDDESDEESGDESDEADLLIDLLDDQVTLFDNQLDQIDIGASSY